MGKLTVSILMILLLSSSLPQHQQSERVIMSSCFTDVSMIVVTDGHRLSAPAKERERRRRINCITAVDQGMWSRVSLCWFGGDRRRREEQRMHQEADVLSTFHARRMQFRSWYL